MNEYTTHADVRDLDWLYLGTVASSDYYEQRLILRVDGQQRSVVGRASDWPLIELRARNAELSARLTASEQRSVEADCHVVEMISRESAYQEHIAALEAQLAAAQPVEMPSDPELAQSADGKVPCNQCGKRFRSNGLEIHKAKMHSAGTLAPAAPAAPPATPIALPLAEPPWRCASCGSDAHSRSISDLTRCIRCLAVEADTVLTNGHALAA